MSLIESPIYLTDPTLQQPSDEDRDGVHIHTKLHQEEPAPAPAPAPAHIIKRLTTRDKETALHLTISCPHSAAALCSSNGHTNRGGGHATKKRNMVSKQAFASSFLFTQERSLYKTKSKPREVEGSDTLRSWSVGVLICLGVVGVLPRRALA